MRKELDYFDELFLDFLLIGACFTHQLIYVQSE